MQIKLTSVFVDDQDKALQFYTEVLGFVKKTEFPLGDFRWLTLVSPAQPDGIELVLEPDNNPATKTFKAALLEQGIPFAAFAVDNLNAEYKRMQALGVRFTSEPIEAGPVSMVDFEDTCGNLIQLYQTNSA